MKICFLFPKIINHTNQRHLRNIFFIEELDIDYLFTYENIFNKNKIFNNFYIKNNNIPHDNIKFLTDNLDKNIEILNYYDTIIICVYHFISEFIYKKFSTRIERRINKNIQKIYIHHGLYKVFYIDKLINKNRGYRINEIFKEMSKMSNRFNYKIITCCNNYQKLLLYSKFNESNLIKTNSLPQFDFNHHLYNNIIKKQNKDIIIFIGEKVEQIKDDIVYKLIDMLRRIYTKKRILIKIKFTTKIKLFKKKLFEKFDNIELLNEESYLGNYLKCYLCIVTGGGTSFFENINFNKKTILFQYKIDEYDSTLFFKYPDIFKKLPICNDLKGLKKELNYISDDSFFDKDYYKDIKNLNKFHIGHKKILNFKNDFINIIKNLNHSSI